MAIIKRDYLDRRIKQLITKSVAQPMVENK